jgi:hypothetical protein
MCRFAHNNKIVLFCCLDGQRKRHYSSTRVYWTRWPLYTSLGPYCWTYFFCSERKSLIHGQARERFTYVGDTMRVGLNKSTRPPLVVGFLPRKKGDTAVTNNVAFMTTIFLFLSIWFFFLSVEFFDSDDYAGCIRGSVCVYTHTGHTSGEFAWPIPFFFFFFGGDPFKLAQKRLFDSRQRKGSTLSVKMYRTLHTQREHRDGEREREAPCVPIYLNSAAHNWHNVPVWKTMNSPTLFSS